MNGKGSDAGRVFRTPILLGGVTIIGLGAALAGDGLLDVLSWVALGVPVVVILYAVARASGRSADDYREAK